MEVHAKFGSKGKLRGIPDGSTGFSPFFTVFGQFGELLQRASSNFWLWLKHREILPCLRKNIESNCRCWHSSIDATVSLADDDGFAPALRFIACRLSFSDRA